MCDSLNSCCNGASLNSRRKLPPEIEKRYYLENWLYYICLDLTSIREEAFGNMSGNLAMSPPEQFRAYSVMKNSATLLPTKCLSCCPVTTYQAGKPIPNVKQYAAKVIPFILVKDPVPEDNINKSNDQQQRPRIARPFPRAFLGTCLMCVKQTKKRKCKRWPH